MRIQIKPLTLIAFFILFPVGSFAQISAQNTQVYVSPHPDDWQLFMNPNAYYDLQKPENKVVFLHISAGDAGSGTGNTSYYLAREEGSLRAIRFLCNAINNDLKQGAEMSATQVLINGHLVLRYVYANAVAYFLRLPDGNLTGVGYPIHNHTSLQKFYDGSVATISAIDNSTKYQSLNDLVKTIGDLVTLESNSMGEVSFNIADTNTKINPRDHSDHIHSSMVMQNVAKQLKIPSVRLYEEYATNVKDQNVFDDAFLINVGTWGVATSGFSDFYHKSLWNKSYNIWIGRQYFRDVLLSELEKE